MSYSVFYLEIIFATIIIVYDKNCKYLKMNKIKQ